MSRISVLPFLGAAVLEKRLHVRKLLNPSLCGRAPGLCDWLPRPQRFGQRLGLQLCCPPLLQPEPHQLVSTHYN